MKPAILILGATGTVGQGVVQAAVKTAWPIVAVARDGAALQALRDRYPHAPLQTLVGSVSDDASADALVTALQKLDRPFIGVIAALGSGQVRGRLLDATADVLRGTLDEVVLPHLIAARHLLPWLGATGRNCGYVVIGGPGGRNPWAGYGHRSVAAAATRMLARVLHSEARTFAVRLQLLEVESPVRTGASDQHACEQWPCADHIGRKALLLLEHRNDSRCNDAVIAYRSETFGCKRADAGADVEIPAPGSSIGKDGLTLEQAQARQSRHREGGDSPEVSPSDAPSSEPSSKTQEMDSSASLLPARCLQDVRKLLETFTPPNKNQERTR